MTSKATIQGLAAGGLGKPKSSNPYPKVREYKKSTRGGLELVTSEHDQWLTGWNVGVNVYIKENAKVRTYKRNPSMREAVEASRASRKPRGNTRVLKAAEYDRFYFYHPETGEKVSGYSEKTVAGAAKRIATRLGVPIKIFGP